MNNPSGVVWMTQDLKLGRYVVIVKGKDDDQIVEEVDKSENQRFPELRNWGLITNLFPVVSSVFMLLSSMTSFSVFFFGRTTTRS